MIAELLLHFEALLAKFGLDLLAEGLVLLQETVVLVTNVSFLSIRLAIDLVIFLHQQEFFLEFAILRSKLLHLLLIEIFPLL